MQRPTQRPTSRMSVFDILEMARQHFVYDKAPRCVDEQGTCVYTGTGCFVGFMLTEEDAAKLPKTAGIYSDPKKMDSLLRDTLYNYFDLGDRRTYLVLRMG